MRRFDDHTERATATATQSEEEVLVLTLVCGAEDAVGSDDLHLDLVVRHVHGPKEVSGYSTQA